MKKMLLTLICILALAGLTLPGLIGAWLPGQVEESLEQNWPDATSVIERSWFSSSVMAQRGNSRLNLKFQHFRWWRGALLDGVGQLELDQPEARIELSVQFGLKGQLLINADSDRIRWPGIETNQVDRIELALELQRNHQGGMSVSADAVRLADPYSNELELRSIKINSNWQNNSEDLRRLWLDVYAQRPDQPASRLQLTTSSIEPEALNQLTSALSELNRAPPESLQAQMAGLGLVSAWQQLVQAGLKFDLHELLLDRQVDIRGSWQPNQQWLILLGGGYTPTALDWLGPILGLNQGIAPEQARQQVWLWMQDASTHSLMTLHGEHFELDTSKADTP
ncbi:MAG: hypothetical protein AAF446_10320 [Pseudomonadota bacterium]